MPIKNGRSSVYRYVVAVSVGKSKKVCGLGILLELMDDESVEAVEAFTHVDRFERHKITGGGPC